MKLRRGLALSAAVLLVGALSACAGKQAVDPALTDTSSFESAEKLVSSAERAAKAQEELARIQTARTKPAPAPLDETLSGIPDELRRRITVEWSGPGVEAAKRVSALIGYSFRVVGNPPATLPMVNVNAREIASAKVLEDIGIQSQPFGQVVVDPGLKRVEYRFLQGARSPGPRSGMTK